MGIEVQSFEEDVLEASARRPVLVDFWAPWCGPCRVLGPVLEKLADEAGDTWTLVKVNSDEHPELSARYGIRGIPAVKLFVSGEVVDEFTGALPEYAVRQWLEKALPSETRAHLAQAEAALDLGRDDEARSLLESVLAAEPTNPQASALLARVLLFEDPARARSLAATGMGGEPRFVQMAESVRLIADGIDRLDTPESLPDEPGREPFKAALVALSAGELDVAASRLIDALQQNRYYDDDGVRRLGVALFTLLGEAHAVTREHRRTFDMWLY